MTIPPLRSINETLLEALRLEKAGRYDDARALCRSILARHPNHVDALHIHGLADIKSDNVDSALKHLQRAVRLKPDLAGAQLNLAFAWEKSGQWTRRAEALKAALKLMPGSANIAGDIALSYRNAARLDEAVSWYEKALAMDPAQHSARVGLGIALMHQGKIEAAEAAYQKVLAAVPHADATANLAILRDMQGRPEEVLALLDQCLAANPEHADVHTHRALAYLARGRFPEGWQEYLWRFKRAGAKTRHALFPFPYWQGEPLSGRRLLVWTEQGPGDELLLGTMLNDVIAAGASCVLVCSSRMVPLFQRSFPAVEVIAAEVAAAAPAGLRADWQASLSHLGAYLRRDFASFATSRSYLKADPARTAELRAQYRAQAGERPLIGIAWHSANPEAAAYKSATLKDFAPVLTDARLQLVSLQYGDVDKSLGSVRAVAAHPVIYDRSINPLTDMDAFAAQVAAMDRVISVSNTTVHVAGALGVPCLTLVPASYGRIWYWFLGREDSPWYPSMRLVRQARGEPWAAAVVRTAPEFLAGSVP